MISIPNFTIEKEVGHGGMATVYLAVQDMLSRHVALKVLLPDMMKDENLRKSFLGEGKIVASLDHPNIVRIYDIGIVDETIFYMSMEYLSGGTLKEKMADGKLAFSEAQHILEEMAKGLAYAHDKGYIHRDIKPGNILFRDDGSAVITDFGIAKLQDTSGELTRLGFTLGTVQYMSPEQATTTDLDARSDIYSLGLVFYEMLTGQKAFKADSNIQAIHQHTTVPPPMLPEEYASLQEVMDKVLAKEPDARYQTVSEFVEAVKNPPPLSKTVTAPEDTIHTDKTVIHNVNDFPVAASSAATSSLKKEGSKKKSLLIPAVLGGLAMMGVVVYGVVNYSSLLGATDSPKNASVGVSQAEKSLLRLKQEELAQQQKAEEERKQQEKQEKLKAEKLTKEKRKQQEELIKQQTKQAKVEKERKQQEAIALQKTEELERRQQRQKQEEIEKQQAERKQQEALAKKKADEEKERQESLAKEKEEEALAEKKAKEENQKQALLDKEKIDKEKVAEEKKKKEALAKKLAKKRKADLAKSTAKKKAAKAAKKKKDLARKKATEKKRKIAAAQAKNALAKKKAAAKRIAIQKQQGQKGHIKIAVTLNKRPLKTKIVLTRSGKHVKTITNSYANFTLAPGNYVVTAFYGGKSSRAAINLGAHETAIQRFAFRGSAAPARKPVARPVPGKVTTSPSDPEWMHTHTY